MILILTLLLAGSMFAEGVDCGIGLTKSPLGTQYQYLMPSVELMINNFDLQFDCIGYACPVDSYYADYTLQYSTTQVFLQGAVSMGYIIKPWDNGNRFGIGVTSYSFYSDDLNECQGMFRQAFRLYYKWSYTFNSGLELCAKNFVSLFGFYNFKTTETGNKWNHENWILYSGVGSFLELGTWWTLVIPVVEVRYHF